MKNYQITADLKSIFGNNFLSKKKQAVAINNLNQKPELWTQNNLDIICKYSLKEPAEIILKNKKLYTQKNFDLLFKSFSSIFQMQDTVATILTTNQELWVQKNFELVCKHDLEESAKIILGNKKLHTQENFKLVLESFSLLFKIGDTIKSILDKKSELWTQESFEVVCKQDLRDYAEIVLRNEEIHTQKNFELMLSSFFLVIRLDYLIKIIFDKNPELWTQKNFDLSCEHGLVESAKLILQNKKLITKENYDFLHKERSEWSINPFSDNLQEQKEVVSSGDVESTDE
jgi:hypothetical protein